MNSVPVNTFVFNESRIPVDVVVRRLRTRYRLSISDRGVRIVLPKDMLPESAEILKRHGRWIEKNYRKIRDAVSLIPEIQDGALIPFRGGKCTLMISHGEGSVEYLSEKSILRLNIAVNGREKTGDILRHWYFSQSADFVKKLCVMWKVKEDFGVSKVAMRDLATRWGTCSLRTKSIVLNWRLIMAPDEIYEYVLAHELAHLEVPGHGRPFWNYMEKVLPGSALKRKWLVKNGYSLLRFLPGVRLPSERIM